MNGTGREPRATLGTALAALRLAAGAAPGLALAQVALAVAGGLAPLALGVLTKLVLDRIAADGSARGPLVALALGLAAAGVGAATLPHLNRYVEANWDRAAAVVAQSRLYAALNRMTGLRELENPAFRDRLRLAEEAGRSSPVLVAGGLLELARSLITVGGFALVLAGLNPWMVALVAVAAIPTARTELSLSRQRARMLWQVSPAARRQHFYADLLTGLAAAKEVRLFGLAGLFHKRMLGELGSINAAHRRLEGRQLVAQVALAVLGAVAAGGGLVWAVLAARAGTLSVGDVAVFVAAVGAVQGAVSGSLGRFATAHHGLLIFTHYRDLTAPTPERAGERPVPRLREGIELRDVWFRYADDQPWILRGVNLFIRAGETIGLVGLNGAGKSTLVKLLVRFYDPDRGAVLWDGVDLRELRVDELRRRMTALFQDFMCYDLSAAENIGVGDTDALDRRERLVAAARQAGVHDTVEALPHGYDTQLTRLFVDESDRADAGTGVLLSGGQWQRLALARGLLRGRRDLLVLDEPSAGLDARAEHDIHRRLRSLGGGGAAVLISHRLNALRLADRIVVLEGGRIVEEGDHDSLLAADGAYAGLFRLQAAGYRDGADELVASPGGDRA
ncbi:ABC transporter ATP-binding protein/permease [Micromonospora sp. PLK6-60]|uniref:ABC transporter ATP-binding protein n=1 Tax=Micromonospora sp. PLK6-60 TaxID=2873383 RepID=UPI001CA76AAE|nr:ABC transporter ATP-binding protein [Micromonospora sp. PLK6-60]MBY8872676.1 ABC transporter ATP-binding protein/permease [Micromonospora sp. PLK6-60]